MKTAELTAPTMNRAMRRAAPAHIKPTGRYNPANYQAGMRVLDHCRPYEPDEMIGEHWPTRAALERLRTGCGDEADFDRVSMILNIGLIRAEAIDQLMVETIQRGQHAFVRMKDRYLRGLALGFDAQGLQDVPLALDAYEDMTDKSSPKQMVLAIKETYARISNGDLLEVVQ